MISQVVLGPWYLYLHCISSFVSDGFCTSNNTDDIFLISLGMDVGECTCMYHTCSSAPLGGEEQLKS